MFVCFAFASSVINLIHSKELVLLKEGRTYYNQTNNEMYLVTNTPLISAAKRFMNDGRGHFDQVV